MLKIKASFLIVIGLVNMISGEVCYVCGSDKETITNPDNVIPIPDEYGSPNAEVDCKTLAAAGMNGLIPDDACTDLQDSLDFKMFCGCPISNETNDVPTVLPSIEMSPTVTPTEILSTTEPTFVVSESPTDRPNSRVSTPTPTTTIQPTTSPIVFQSSNEPTDLPTTVDAIDGENLDDTPIIEVTGAPSEAPSDVPSSQPSSVPSGVPSDVPSALPTVDRDLSGVITESSGTIASLFSIAPTVAGLLYIFSF